MAKILKFEDWRPSFVRPLPKSGRRIYIDGEEVIDTDPLLSSVHLGGASISQIVDKEFEEKIKTQINEIRDKLKNR